MKVKPFKPKSSNLSPSKVEGRPFVVTGATAGTGKYGEVLILDVRFSDTREKGQICCSLENRGDLYDDLREQLADVDAVGPVTFQTIAGGTFYHLLPVEGEEVPL